MTDQLLSMPARTPSPSAVRMPPLETLPLFMTLSGKRTLVAGRTDMAQWKAELLHAAGAIVDIFAEDEEGAATFATLKDQPRLTIHARRWDNSDLVGSVLAIAEQDEGFADAARAAGVPFNIIDQPAISSVNFGTIVNRSPIVIGIATGGGAPALGQAIRTKIEALIPHGLSAWVTKAKQWRSRLKADIADFPQRRRFWQQFAQLALGNADREPRDDDYNALLSAEAGPMQGRVIFAGSGPGDPGHITLATAQALQIATVVMHDDLVSLPVLDLARREARRISVGKRGGGPSCKQTDVNALLVRLASAGETVVRLKGGDPLIFGRLTEEVEACHGAGIETTILPGISAAQGAAASLGISLTERHLARRVQFLTGHGSDGMLPNDIHWLALADPKVTSVVYMPRKTLAEFAVKAIESGLAPDTPATAIASATRPDQAWVTAPISDIAGKLGTLASDAPTLIIIGQVAAQTGLGKTAASADGVRVNGE